MLYRQKDVAQAQGVPFQSKVDLVVEAVEALAPLPGTKTHILVDAWYTCYRLWRACLEGGFAVTGGLKVNRWLRLADPQQPGRWQKVRLSSYITQLEPRDFTLAPWRGRLVAAHLVRTFVYKLGKCQVLLVKEDPEAPPKSARCWATSDLEADAATVASYAAQRWDIETFIEDAKGLLGLDHYQITSTEGVIRFCHMVCCCYLYLDEVRAGFL
jgi:Transposase DDE domain